MNSSHPCMIGDLLRFYCGKSYHCTFPVEQIQLDTCLKVYFSLTFDFQNRDLFHAQTIAKKTRVNKRLQPG